MSLALRLVSSLSMTVGLSRGKRPIQDFTKTKHEGESNENLSAKKRIENLP
jgi:hypothetical protein